MNINSLVQKTTAFFQQEWKFFLILLLVLGVVWFGYSEWQIYKTNYGQANVVTVTSPPQIINTKTETVREVAVTAPTTEGAVLTFAERQGKVVAIINGKEVEVPNQSGQPNVEIGKNGQLSIATTQTAKLDVTALVNEQARLVAQAEVQKQWEADQKILKKEKADRNKERLLWIVGTGGLIYLTR